MKKTVFVLLFIAFWNQTIFSQNEVTILSISNVEKAPFINKNIYGHFAEHLGRSIYGNFLWAILPKFLI